MDVTALRALQAPLKDEYRTNPEAAVITLKAHGELDDQHIACKVETGRAIALAGLHPATGGSGAENYPPFDIEKIADDHFRITVAVAGV